MSRQPLLTIALFCLTLSGCAAEPSQRAPAKNSPVNSSAMESPPPVMETLALSADVRARGPTSQPALEMPEMKGMGHGHAHHMSPATEPDDNAAPSAPRWTPTSVPASQASLVFTCKMHGQVISNTPGKCPICHMMLVQKPAATQAGKPAQDHSAHQHGGKQ